MPLEPGNTPSVISRNISELTHHGSRPRSHAQIVAIALSNADKYPHHAAGGNAAPRPFHLMSSPHVPAHVAQPMSPSMGDPWWTRSEAKGMGKGFAEGGGLGMAEGGVMSVSEGSPWWERADSRMMQDVPHGGGLINSSVAGRTDRLPLAVGTESHIITGDVVSGLGQGNTLAGARILTQALRTGPYGTALPQAVHAHTIPHPPPLPSGEAAQLSKGGDPGRVGILAAGGEYVVPQEDWVARDEQDGKEYLHRGVRSLGGGDTKEGHAVLDRMMKNVRQHTMEFLRHAPPPKR